MRTDGWWTRAEKEWLDRLLESDAVQDKIRAPCKGEKNKYGLAAEKEKGDLPDRRLAETQQEYDDRVERMVKDVSSHLSQLMTVKPRRQKDDASTDAPPRDGLSIGAWWHLCSRAWAQLPEDKKKIYIDQAREEKQKFLEQLSADGAELETAPHGLVEVGHFFEDALTEGHDKAGFSGLMVLGGPDVDGEVKVYITGRGRNRQDETLLDFLLHHLRWTFEEFTLICTFWAEQAMSKTPVPEGGGRAIEELLASYRALATASSSDSASTHSPRGPGSGSVLSLAWTPGLETPTNSPSTPARSRPTGRSASVVPSSAAPSPAVSPMRHSTQTVVPPTTNVDDENIDPQLRGECLSIETPSDGSAAIRSQSSDITDVGDLAGDPDLPTTQPQASVPGFPGNLTASPASQDPAARAPNATQETVASPNGVKLKPQKKKRKPNRKRIAVPTGTSGVTIPTVEPDTLAARRSRRDMELNWRERRTE
ncbi:hypothetical protein C8Q79DRAFT_1007716 [Trametes meyenii]|nr:hypothetical protein C8Q79DRAFT_1007716 [Trametes meyenii]